MRAVTWYFDFISPYSYFGLHALKRLPADVAVDYQPVLLAGLLNHWGQKGPAEVPPKRIWTLRSCIWWAKQNNVPFRFPVAHPFNSLPYLRLSIAAGNSPGAIQKIFTALWTTGCNPADPKVISGLAASLRVPLDRIADADVKNALRDATARAVQRQVFGVPSLCIDEHVFWGNDAVDFAVAYLADPGILATDEMKRADTLPIGVSRPGVSGSL
jgi:2-hydroxychromene-2-carboxylate isomerase